MTSSARLARRAIAGSALACCAALAAACGASPGTVGQPGGSSPPAAPTSAATASPLPRPGTSAPATSPAAAGVAPCPTRYLGVKAGVGQGTGGSIYQPIDFTNISNVTCTLYGYPGVSFGSTGTAGGQIGLAAKESPQTPRKLVTLAPGAVANVLLQIVQAGNYPAAMCQMVTAHWLVIYPPNQTTPVYLRYTVQACAKPVPLLTVSVVQPGAGSS